VAQTQTKTPAAKRAFRALRREVLAFPDPPDDGDDDEQQHNGAGVRAGGQAVDSAGEGLHLVVGHGGNPVFRVRRVEAQGLQLARHVGAVD